MRTFLIVDDHEIVRRGLTVLLSDFYPDTQIFEAQDEGTAIERLKKNKVELVILDVQMPHSNSLRLLEHIHTRYPETKVLIFSMGPESLYGRRFLKAGAKGYLSKEAPVEEVKKAVETVLKGRSYVSEELMDSFVGEMSGEKQGNPFTQLSNREFEITSLLLSGLSVSEIALQLHLHPSTIGTYKARIFEKLKVANLLQLKELASIYHYPG